MLFVALKAQAQQHPIWDVPAVDQGLFDLGVAWGIKENCAHISENKLAGLTFMFRLNRQAKEQGYSTSEVKSFVEDPIEKQYLEFRVREYLENEGLDPAIENNLCEFGRDQISKRTVSGKLLIYKSPQKKE